VQEGVKQAAGISTRITLADWSIEGWSLQQAPYVLAPKIENAGYTFEFKASRKAQHYLLKVILPMVLIVMMSWAVFWIDPTNAGSQISVATTSMLTLIAYRFSVDALVPRLPYMTRLDTFILASSLLVFISLIQVLLTTTLAAKGRLGEAHRIDRYCRVIFPLVFAIASTVILVKGTA
jgi:hypothetical protein